MINSTQDLLDKVLELKAAISDLPDIKNIEINVTGNAVEMLELIKEDISSLDDRTVEINIVYKNIGGPEDIKEATQVVNQVVIPASDNIKEQTQIVNDVTRNVGEPGLSAEQTEAASNALHAYSDEVDDAAEATARLTSETRETTTSIEGLEEMADRAAENVDHVRESTQDYSETVSELSATVDRVNESLNNGDMTVIKATRNLSKLIYSTDDASSAQDSFAAAVDNIRAHLDDAGLTVNQTVAVMSRLKYIEDQAGISASNLAAAQEKSAVETENFMTVSDALARTIQASSDASLTLARNDSVLNDALGLLAAKAQDSSGNVDVLAAILARAGADADAFVRNVNGGTNMLVAFSEAAHDAGSSVGAALIPITAATFGITGMATAIHLIVMGVFEFLAVFIPAMIAAGAAALVMMQGVGVVADGLKSMYTATEALGPALGATSGDMLGLGHSLQTAQNDANAGVYELLGEAIIGVQRATGPTTDGLSAFGQMGLTVERIMQNFIANLDVGLAQSMGTVRTVLSSGVSDLTEFGQILGNIGHAILNLAADMPGLAEIILKLIDGFSDLIKWVSNLPPGLIAVVMGIEEAYRWSGLLAGAVGLLGRAIALIGTLGIPVFAKIGMNFAAMAASLISGVAGLVSTLATGFAKIAEFAEGMAKAMDAEALAGGIDAAATAVESGAIGIVSGLSKVVEFLGGPWGAAIALAVVGLGILIFWLSRSTPTATEIFINNINKAVAAASNLTVLNVIGTSMAGVTNKIAQQGQIMAQSMHEAAVSAQATVGPYQASTNAVQAAVGPYNSVAVNAGHLTTAQKDAADAASQSVGPYNSQTNAMKAAAEQTRGAVGVYGTIPEAAANAGIAIQALTAEQQKLFGEATQVIGGAQTISKAYGTDFVSSLGLADIAGVNLSSTQVKLGADANAAGIKIEGLVQGYQKMGQTGSILSNSMAAVNVQAGLQASKVSALNQAWDAFMSMSQSLTGGIASVNADLSQMGNIAPVVGSKISALSGDTSMSVGQIAQSLKSFSGQSAQTWQSYNSALSSAETFTDSLRTGMAAGAVSGTQYKETIANVAQEFLPYAKNSSAARAELDVLLQEAGQPFTTNFSTMKAWIDKNAVSTGNFTNLIDTLTAKLSNVGAVAKNFAGTLQSDVIGAIAQAAVGTANITGLASNYTKALEANGSAAGSTKSAQEAFNQALMKLGFTQTDVNQLDSELTTGYGKQAAAAANLKGATDTAGQSVSNFANAHVAPATTALDTIKAHTDDFGKALNPGLTGSMNSAGGGADNLGSAHITPLRSAMDTIKAHTDDFGQSLNPALTTSMANAGHGADDLSSSHLTPARAAIDTIKAHTDDFGQALDPGLTDSIGTTASRVDDWRSSHLGPAQTAVDTIKAHTDDFGRSLDPGLTGSLDTAGSHSDSLHNAHLTPLQTIVQDLNRFVGDFESAMKKWPAAESTNVKVSGSGTTKINSTIPGVTGGTIDLGIATGGVLPGYAPGVDSIPAMLSPGEGILVPEAVRALGGAKTINELNRSYRMHFASGGIATPNVTGWAEHTLGTATTDITNGYKDVITAAVNAMKNQAAELALASGPMGGATGSEMQNGAELYQYLLKNVFDGHKIAAAGAIASIWGECVTLDHKILTKRGYLNHDEVTTDDETMGYNPETDKSEWTRITRVVHYEEKPLITLYSGKWSSTFTPNHRWLTEEGMKKYIDLSEDDKIVLSREADTGAGLPISADEAVTLGLLASRGHVDITPEHQKDLLGRAGDAKLDALYQVLHMSPEQRKEWLRAILATDLPTPEERAVIHTELRRNGIVANAIELALFFEGYHRDMPVSETEEKKVSGFGDVWCVTTELGTWTARKDAFSFFTGNSEWNPLTSGTGGRGLIGWTPEGTISNAAFNGGMATQEPAIIAFINSSGDEGVIREMMSATSVSQAANEWGVGVERYGIDDVHAEGIALATSIMNAGGSSAPAQGEADVLAKAAQTHDAGGWIYPGLNMINNKTGRLERTVPPGGDNGEIHVHMHINDKEFAHEVFPAIQQEGFRYASRNNGNASNKGQWAPK